MSIIVGNVSIYDYPEQFNDGFLTGAQPLWSDNSDETSATGFATLESEFAVATIMYAPLTGATGAAEMTVTVRAQWGIANTGFQAKTAFVSLYDSEPIAPTGSLAGGSIDASSLGVTEDLTVILDSTTMNSPHTWPEVLAALETGNLWLSVQPAFPSAFGNNNGLTVFEVDVTVAGINNVPPRRLYPRPSLARIYPPPPTQQSGGRFGSSSIL